MARGSKPAQAEVVTQMAEKPKGDEPPKRLNRTVSVSEALGAALDPVLKKRGFASRDILTHWGRWRPPPMTR